MPRPDRFRPVPGRERLGASWRTLRGILASHVSTRSVWFRNSVRGAAALALAVAVVEITGVSHGFWVILGAISVLRSNALDTDATALRAVAGTLVGFAIGAAIMVGIGDHVTWLWVALPVSVFLAGVAPTFVSFAAGQAGFTVAVIVLFNLIQPVGWKVGLTRIEDVAIGCAVSVVVGVLFWPRGATAALGVALCDSFALGSEYLGDAVDVATGTGPRPLEVVAERSEAQHQRLDDAFRQYLMERGTRPVPVPTVSALFNAATRTRLVARSMAGLPGQGNDAQPAPAVSRARDDLQRRCQELRAWYLTAGDVLAGRQVAVPGPPLGRPGEREAMIEAFEQARLGHPDQLRLALRILWADESLQDLRALQATVAGVVERFSRRPWPRGPEPRAGVATTGQR